MWNPILQTSFFCMRLFIVFNIFFAISLLICGPFEVLPQVEGQKSNDIFCPVGCRCSGQSIMCRNSLRELPSLPAFIGGDTGGVIQYLGVHSSLITNIRSSAFLGQEDLVRIDLTSNRISEVASDALVGLASLRRLSLRDNHLIRLPDSVFFPVSELEELDLAENRLQTLPYSLESLARLTRLRLSNNPLHCPCHLVDFALNLGVFETAQQPVVCHSPSEVLGVPLAVLGRRLREYSNDSRYLGYSEAVPEENERSEFGGLRIHRLLVGPGKEWPWPHCPIDDFGGRPARSRLLESSTRRSEANEKDGEEGGDAVPEHQGLVMPAITKPPESVLATPGEIVQFVCQVEGQPIPKIVWRIPTNASHFIRLHQRREVHSLFSPGQNRYTPSNLNDFNFTCLCYMIQIGPKMLKTGLTHFLQLRRFVMELNEYTLL
ncbi:unnamed protein product [Protopolystoma xenopodis]|uniref:Ig-like domain-containing protein n=1 Tax=Protopolystoma xenopodis TaxID=117903 RepID=A0A3S5BR65_9PLAT|nr:unnamed protein product [Protopolystoma xenopodis]